MQGGQRVILEVRWGLLAFTKVVLDPGGSVRVGRGERSDLAVPHDSALSAVHFEVSWDGSKCRIRDLESVRGIQVDGVPATSAELQHGSWIRAGNTLFSP